MVFPQLKIKILAQSSLRKPEGTQSRTQENGFMTTKGVECCRPRGSRFYKFTWPENQHLPGGSGDIMSQEMLHNMFDDINTLIENEGASGFSRTLPYFFHEDWNVRKQISQLLAKHESKGLRFLISEIEKEKDEDKKQNLCYWTYHTLIDSGVREIEVIHDLFEHSHSNIRKYLLDIPDLQSLPGSTPFIYNALSSDSWDVRAKASRCLVDQGKAAVQFLDQNFTRSNEHQKFWTFKITAKVLGSDAIKYFSKFLKQDSDNDQIQIYAVSNLGEIQDARVIKSLLNFLKTDSFLIQEEVYRSLCKLAKTQQEEMISILTARPDTKSMETLLRVLESSCDASILEHVDKLFLHKDYQTRYLAVSHLGNFQHQLTARKLIQVFTDERWAIRKLAMEKIANLKTFSIPVLLETLDSKEEDLVFWALQSLRVIREETTLSALSKVLYSDSKKIALLALEVIASINTENSCEIFIENFDNPNWEVRQKASELFEKLDCFPIPYLLGGCLNKNTNISFWSLKTLERLELNGARSFVELIQSNQENPHLYLSNLRLADQDLLRKQLSKKSPNFLSIEESIAKNSTQSNSQIIQRVESQSLYLDADLAPIPELDGIEVYETDLESLFDQAFNLRASDIHLKIGHPPVIRVNGRLSKMKHPALEPDHMVGFIHSLLIDRHVRRLEKNYQVDTSFQTVAGVRLRVNVYKTMHGYEVAGRFISDVIPSFETLNLPIGIMQRVSTYENGLVILTGPTGSGKSSTLASMINYVNLLTQKHIICIEDPVEYVHTSRQSYISQREVHRDVSSFPSGIRATLREDPDVILIGELRDRESVETALTLAGTGHLVMTTLHAPTCTTAIEQLMDFFMAEHQEHIRKQIAFNLKAIVSQRLLRHKSGHTRIPACEIMVNTPAVRNVIRDGKTEQLPTLIETSKKEGMVSLDQTLKDMIKRDVVTMDEVWPHVIDTKTFRID